jgi:hypothetical protein
MLSVLFAAKIVCWSERRTREKEGEGGRRGEKEEEGGRRRRREKEGEGGRREREEEGQEKEKERRREGGEGGEARGREKEGERRKEGKKGGEGGGYLGQITRRVLHQNKGLQDGLVLPVDLLDVPVTYLGNKSSEKFDNVRVGAHPKRVREERGEG